MVPLARERRERNWISDAMKPMIEYDTVWTMTDNDDVKAEV